MIGEPPYGIFSDRLSSGLTVLRLSDKLTIVTWLIGVVVILALFFVSPEPWMLVMPFLAPAVVYLLFNEGVRILAAAAVVNAVSAALCISGACTYHVVYLAYLVSFGIIGSASVGAALQRALFYPVMVSLRDANIQENPSLRCSLVAFIFSTPRSVDTRKARMTAGTRSFKSVPEDVMRYMVPCMALMMCIWIYIEATAPFNGDYFPIDPMIWYTGVIIYAPAVISAFSIFRIVDAGFTSDMGMFRIYDGFRNSMAHLLVPLLVIVVLVFFAQLGSSNIMWYVVYFVVTLILSLVFLVAISFIQFYLSEPSTIAAVSGKWATYMPVSLSRKREDEEAFLVYGEPARDESDISDIIITSRNKGQ